MNNVSLIGNLTRDPELKYLPSNNTPVVNYSIVVTNFFRKDDDGKPTADFINCVTFGKAAESLATYMKKGCKLGITGRIQVRRWQDQEGRNRYATEIITNSVDFLTFPKEDMGKSYPQESEDDLPF